MQTQAGRNCAAHESRGGWSRLFAHDTLSWGARCSPEYRSSKLLTLEIDRISGGLYNCDGSGVGRACQEAPDGPPCKQKF